MSFSVPGGYAKILKVLHKFLEDLVLFQVFIQLLVGKELFWQLKFLIYRIVKGMKRNNLQNLGTGMEQLNSFPNFRSHFKITFYTKYV